MDAEDMGPRLPRLYTDLAEWFHLLTPPQNYAGEAAFYRETMVRESRRTVRTVLELGSGGGNNASYLKHHFAMTLVDIAEPMLDISRRLNPECEHLPGDMRNVRLGRRFDAVFIHDAISYVTTETDLAAAIATAYVHCRPGGVALFAPDYTRETFTPATRHGGSDSTIINNGGNLRQNNVNLIIEPTSAPTMTDIVITCGIGVDLRYTDDVLQYAELEIDSETMTISNDGVDAFAELSFLTLHTLDRFLALDPGNNTFLFTVTGATAIKVTFTYYDAWA